MNVSYRLTALAVAAITGLVGVGLVDTPRATAETSVSDSVASTSAQLQSAVSTATATYQAKSAAAATTSSTYAALSASTAKAKAVYGAKKKISTASAARLKVVHSSKKYSASYKATAKKNSAAKVKATATAKATYLKKREAALKAKAAAEAAKIAAGVAKRAADAAAAALAAAIAAGTAGSGTGTGPGTGTGSGADTPDTVLPPLATDLLAARANDAAMPVGSVLSNGRTWKQSYAEDFTRPAALGKVLSSYPRLEAYDGFADTSGQGRYAPAKVLSVSDSNLDFYLHSENGQPLVAAVMPDGYAPHTTGRVSIRYRSDDILGYKFVGMFWPSSDNWNDGEIDWPEANLGSSLPRPASAVPGSFSGGRMNFKPNVEAYAATDQSDYHVATTEWDTHAIRYYWDGELVSTVTDAVPTKAMRVTLQAETFIGEGTVPKNTSGHLDIDWISIWD